MKISVIIIFILISFTLKAEPLHVVINGNQKFNDTIGTVDLHTSTTNFTEIELDQSSSQSSDLTSVLENNVGIQTHQTGGLGSYSSVSLRAASSEQVLVFLDGILLNDSVSGQVDLSLIPINQIQRIEVFRGATPIELGAASMGGAINIITRSDSNGSNLIGIGFDNHDGKYANIHWSKLDKNNHFRFVSQLIDNKNKYPIINDNGTTLVTNDDFEDTRNNAEILQESFLFTWKHIADNKTSSINSVRYFNKHQNLPNFNNSPNASASFNTELVQLNSKLSFDNTFGANSESSAELYFRNKEEIYDDQESEIGLRQNYLLFKNNLFGLKGYIKKKLDTENELRFVLDTNHQNSLSRDLLGNLNDVTHNRDTTIINLGYRKYFLNSKSTFNTIIASEYINDNLDDAYDYFDNLIAAQNRTYNFTDLRLGYSKRITHNTKLKINLGEYHRAPYLYELYGDRGFFHGNEELKAESSINFDIGLNHFYQNSESIFNSTRFYFGFFQNKSKDLIVVEYSSRGVGVPDNIDDALIRGLESNISWPFIKNHSLKLNITLLDPRIISNDPLYDDNYIPGQFLESYLLAYTYSKYSWFYNIEYAAKYGKYYERANLPNNRAKDQELLNLKIKRIFDDHNFIFSIKNILDHSYEDYNGYPKPGRTINLSYTYKF